MRRSGARCDETNKAEVEDGKVRQEEAAKSRSQESTSAGVAVALHDEECSGEDPTETRKEHEREGVEGKRSTALRKNLDSQRWSRRAH